MHGLHTVLMAYSQNDVHVIILYVFVPWIGISCAHTNSLPASLRFSNSSYLQSKAGYQFQSIKYSIFPSLLDLPPMILLNS